MKDPEEILQGLADKSSKEKQSQEEWLQFLLELEFEVRHWVSMTENEIKRDEVKP